MLRVDFIFGLAPTTTLRKHVADLEASTTARLEASAKRGKVRRFKKFVDGAASWSRVERIIARVEVGAHGGDIRFVPRLPSRRSLTRRLDKHRNGDHSVASGRQKLIAVHQGG
ncbi:hypothetical protein X769_32055 [Mesorhizobium sp. LSJC268A00]|nr:hypothetical protein X769_32055 [Mesorhizobium sp. LSJC268A00]